MISDPILDAAVDAAEQRYSEQRPNSAALAAEAARWMPGGNTRSVLDFSPFPFRVAAADGPYLVDVDGFRYLDLLGNYTAGLLGHHPAELERVFKEVAAAGLSVGAIGADEADAARLICERFRSIDQVRITNSGTEANLMAIATAQHHTSRSKVVVCDGAYHGGMLYFSASGKPLLAPHEWLVGQFNDPASFDAIFAADGTDIACVIVEPMMGAAGCLPPAPGFLQRLRRLCDHHGALLLFDEVMTSRLAPGGAQALFDVEPDMTTLGKFVAGGFTFGAFGGSKAVMRAFDPAAGGSLTHGGTFNNNPLTIAGIRATLGTVLTDDLLASVNALGDDLRTKLDGLFTASDVPMSVTGRGSLMNLHGLAEAPRCVDDVAAGNDRWKALLFHHLLAVGFYVARRGFISLSSEITAEHVDRLVNTVAGWLRDPLHPG